MIVKTKLEKPIIKEESFTITCIEELTNYKIHDAEYEVKDITDIINIIMDKLKELGHDGTMEIKIKRSIWFEEQEISFDDFITGRDNSLLKYEI